MGWTRQPHLAHGDLYAAYRTRLRVDCLDRGDRPEVVWILSVSSSQSNLAIGLTWDRITGITGASNAVFVVGLSLVSGNVGGMTKKSIASAAVFLGLASGYVCSLSHSILFKSGLESDVGVSAQEHRRPVLVLRQ